MKITILGATGGCGQQLVLQATERGHIVTTLSRGSASVPAGVTAVRGDLTDTTALRSAIRGADVVMSALGLRLKSLAPWSKPEVPDFLSRSTPALVEAMKAEGITRLLAISAGGVGDSRSKVPAFFRMFVSSTALRHAYAELEVMERLLLASGLDVCIARPTGLTDGPRTGSTVVCASIVGRATISRADVAQWMLDAAEKPSFPERTPLITVTGAG